MSAHDKGLAAERLAQELSEQARAAENSRLNPSPVFDLPARRASRPVDAGTIIRNIDEGVAALYTDVASWPYIHMRESHIIGAERSLVALQGLLIDLRAFVPATEPA
jgi:hypothetical protein